MTISRFKQERLDLQLLSRATHKNKKKKVEVRRKGDDEVGDALVTLTFPVAEAENLFVNFADVATSCVFFLRLTISEPDVYFLSTEI